MKHLRLTKILAIGMTLSCLIAPYSTYAGAASGVFSFAPASDVKTVEGEGLGPLSREAITHKTSKAVMPTQGLVIQAESEFYGHDSAIDRDYVQYGWKAEARVLNVDFENYFIDEFSGDRFHDILTYDGENLCLCVNEPNRTDGKTAGRTKFDQSAVKTYPIGLDAVLRGSGDFNRDDYADALLIGKDGTIYVAYAGVSGFAVKSYGKTTAKPETVHCGDTDGDGICDLLHIEGGNITVSLFDGETFTEQSTVKSAFDGDVIFTAVGDVNNDRKADVCFVEKKGSQYIFRTLFRRGNGLFGPTAEELGNKNLYAEYKTSTALSDFAIGDIDGDGVEDFVPRVERNGKNTLNALIQKDEPAYDYSMFGMKTEDGYRLYAGGRWFDQSDSMKNSKRGAGIGDGDHVLLYTSEDGVTWDRYIEGPTFYLGLEMGNSTDWWCSDTLEPEVIYVDGVYHMFIQSYGIEPTWYDDMIGYASSIDGIHFTRKTDLPVVLPSKGKTHLEFDQHIGFNHEEVIYVPDDPEGKCFWMYTGHYVDNKFQGYVRIRSADPTAFYWDERESVNNLSYIGNQIGYISDFDGFGNRLFVRISYHTLEDADGSRTVPTLQTSLDGLNWEGTELDLACTDIKDPVASGNKNVFFLGFTTINGTGELDCVGDNTFEFYYFATTGASSVAPDIFYAEAGVGKATVTIAY